jgi:hypothetical protein
MVDADVTVIADISERNIAIRADPSQIHQVVMNLCVNAAHAMSPGGGTLTVGLEVVENEAAESEGSPSLPARAGPAEGSGGRDRLVPDLPPGRYAGLSVRDTGHGMDGPRWNASSSRFSPPSPRARARAWDWHGARHRQGLRGGGHRAQRPRTGQHVRGLFPPGRGRESTAEAAG